MLTSSQIAYVVSNMRSYNRPLTMAEAAAQIDGMYPLMAEVERGRTILAVMTMIAAQEFEAARKARKDTRERQAEKAFIRKILKAVLDLDPHYVMSVNDGGEVFECLGNITRAINVIYTVDQASVRILDGRTRESIGKLVFILGNAPDEVLADWGWANTARGHALNARLDKLIV